jgi:hypothetical protein
MSIHTLGRLIPATLIGTALFLAACSSHKAAVRPAPSAPALASQAGDLFVGTWKIDLAKTTAPGIAAETIIIELQGGAYKFIEDRLGENESHLHFWTVTDMQGAEVRLTQMNGQPMSDSWRFTRQSATAFVVESAGIIPGKQEFEVNPDGQTLTVRVVLGNGKTVVIKTRPDNGRNVSEDVLVFNRVP